MFIKRGRGTTAKYHRIHALPVDRKRGMPQDVRRLNGRRKDSVTRREITFWQKGK